MNFIARKYLYLTEFGAQWSIENYASIVSEMAWSWTGDKPLPEAIVAQFIAAYMRYSFAMRLWVIRQK